VPKGILEPLLDSGYVKSNARKCAL
jgi:hypothetical protein